VLQVFNLKKCPFNFNNETFFCFDKSYVPYLLGKHGNQTAINTAGSAWKKTIRRYLTEKQSNKEYPNPKWLELKMFLEGHLNAEVELFKPNRSLLIRDLDSLAASTTTRDKKLLGDFLRFRELQKNELIHFKEDFSFRKKTLPEIFDDGMNFKRTISNRYIYLLLTLYITRKYSIFDKYAYRSFANKICEGKQDYLEKFYNGLKSDTKIENLTALCYTQYFWFDYRLSKSDHSEIHLILYNLFNELHLAN